MFHERRENVYLRQFTESKFCFPCQGQASATYGVSCTFDVGVRACIDVTTPGAVLAPTFVADSLTVSHQTPQRRPESREVVFAWETKQVVRHAHRLES